MQAKSPTPLGRAQWLRTAFGGACAVILAAAAFSPQTAWAQAGLVITKPDKPRDQAKELALKITQPFTVVAVGDMIQMYPFARSNDPDIQALVKTMREADLTLANKENNIVDHLTFRGKISHMEAPRSVADDWADMGIDMVSKANNHTFDNGDDGLWSAFKELERVGIQHVGADYNETEARMTRSVSTPKGTAGMVGIYARSPRVYGLPQGPAVYVTAAQLQQLKAMRKAILARRSEVERPVATPAEISDEVLVFGVNFKAGKPGDPVKGDPFANYILERMATSDRQQAKIESHGNDLRLTAYNTVTAAQMAQLREIAGDKGSGERLKAFGVNFKVGPKIGEYSYEMNPQDLRNILREIRTGKQFNDFHAVTVHWHQNRYSFQAYSFDHGPADFQVELAHAAIDQGADLFFAHGVHTLKGVEIYKGKPIFYGLSNFVFHQQVFRSWRDYGHQEPAPLTGPLEGEAEHNHDEWNWLQQPANLKALVAETRYEGGRLKEVRLHPAELGLTERPSSQYGTPKRPSPAIAREILAEVAEYSKPFGTRISIEDGVGVIRIGDAAR